MFKSILVLESAWDNSSVQSKSVWPFVSEFAKATNIQAFHQSFSDRHSFEHWIECYNREPLAGQKLLYIAAHGSEGRISGLKRSVNGTTITSSMKKATNIQYVHFGSCFYGSESNLRNLLYEAEHIRWAAGYQRSVDWIDSTLFDIMLWGRIVNRNTEETKGIKTHTLAKELFNEIPGLAKNLGFRFQYRYGEKNETLFND
jgi:hypothetical protein